MKWYNGEKHVCSLRRLHCGRCKRLHIELPDILTPRKHYATEVIENVVDEVSTPDDVSTECYPCERTMQRWKAWIHENRVQIEGFLQSVCRRFSPPGFKLPENGGSLLQELRSDGAGWRRGYGSSNEVVVQLKDRLEEEEFQVQVLLHQE